ncbi:MAG: YciI family protein [Alphaproteobacteria bacterium]|nr:YciI family protein [Alphaproteobacteria bacterium]
MLYAILCYNSEALVESWTKEEDDAVMTRLDAVNQKLIKQGRLGPTVRLMPTAAAKSLRKGQESAVKDGPFVETKEQLLGFYIVECATPEDAITTAQELSIANAGTGGYEIRPLRLYMPSNLAD